MLLVKFQVSQLFSENSQLCMPGHLISLTPVYIVELM